MAPNNNPAAKTSDAKVKLVPQYKKGTEPKFILQREDVLVDEKGKKVNVWLDCTSERFEGAGDAWGHLEDVIQKDGCYRVVKFVDSDSVTFTAEDDEAAE